MNDAKQYKRITKKSRVKSPILTAPKNKKELLFIEKPLLCKIGKHKWDSMLSGSLYKVLCKKCYKEHWIYK